MASTVASYVAVVEAGPYLTSVDIRPNTLCKGGGASRPPCTTHASGQPLLYKASRLLTAFYTESPEILYQSLFLDVYGRPLAMGSRAVCRAV